MTFIQRLAADNRAVWALLAGLILAVAVLALAGDWLIGMDGVAAYSTALDVMMALAAFLIIQGLLRLWDNHLGIDTWDRIRNLPPMAFAVYLVGRLSALCLLVGLTLS